MGVSVFFLLGQYITLSLKRLSIKMTDSLPARSLAWSVSQYVWTEFDYSCVCWYLHLLHDILHSLYEGNKLCFCWSIHINSCPYITLSLKRLSIKMTDSLPARSLAWSVSQYVWTEFDYSCVCWYLHLLHDILHSLYEGNKLCFCWSIHINS